MIVFKGDYMMRSNKISLAVLAICGALTFGVSVTQAASEPVQPYAKFRGDAQNTGRGGGSGAVGEKKWEFTTGFEIYASPAIGPDGTVYIVSNDHSLYALDGQTGVKKWEYKSDTLGGSYPSPGQAPAIGADGTVYVGDPGGYDDSNRGQLLALDGKTGAKKWAFKAKAPVYTSPSIGTNGFVYFGSNDAFLYAVDSATGKQKWKFEAGGQIHSSPAIAKDGSVYFGSDDQKVYAVDGTTGKQKWSFATNSYVQASPAVGDDGTVYAVSSGSLLTGPANLYALDGKTGKQKWAVEGVGGKGSPAIAKDGTVIMQGDNGRVVALDKTTGKAKWEFVLRSLTRSSPSIGADGTIYTVAGNTLYALDSADGNSIWEITLGKFGVSSPAIGSDGTVYFGSGDNKVYAVR